MCQCQLSVQVCVFQCVTESVTGGGGGGVLKLVQYAREYN